MTMWFVLWLAVCSAGLLADSAPMLAAGSCASVDEEFNSEEGGCLDFHTGLVWGRRREEPATYGKALEYCRTLDEGGFSEGWRLPLGSELAVVGKNLRAQKHFNFKVSGFYWSDKGNRSGSNVVNLAGGEDSYFRKANEPAETICVREPDDRDGDHVPDSSDQCNGTERGSIVETTGHRKGCSKDDLLLPLPKGHLSPCEVVKRSEDCRKVRGCGWSHVANSCIDIWTRKCPRYPDPLWCRLTPGCDWVNGHCVYETPPVGKET